MSGDDMFWCLLAGRDIGFEESIRVPFSLAVVQMEQNNISVLSNRIDHHPRRKDTQQKGVTENNVINVFHQGVVHEIFVDEEEDGQVDLFASQQTLLIEAEAFDFGKVGSYLKMGDGT